MSKNKPLVALTLVAGLTLALSIALKTYAKAGVATQARTDADVIRQNEKLVRELAGMGAVALLTRERFLALRRNASRDEREQLDTVWRADYRPFDAVNTQEMKRLLHGRSWFRRSEVGARVAQAAQEIVQHSDDLKFQREVLVKMEPLVGTPELKGEDYALLYDRVAISEKRLQRYGTQGTACQNGKFAIPRDVEDVRNLDQRRAQMGMEPMAAYLVEEDEMYGACDEPAK